jgi:hypothetical protein
MTDLAVTGMLQDWRHSDAQFVVVNRNPAPVHDTLIRLGIAPAAIAILDGDSPIAEFVEGWEREANLDVIAALQANDDDDSPVVAAWSPEHAAAVIEIDTDASGRVVLRTEEPSPQQNPYRPRQGTESEPLRTSQLRDALVGATALHVRWPSGTEQAVGSNHTWRTEIGHSDRWRLLVPFGGPTEAGYRRM